MHSWNVNSSIYIYSKSPFCCSGKQFYRYLSALGWCSSHRSVFCGYHPDPRLLALRLRSLSRRWAGFRIHPWWTSAVFGIQREQSSARKSPSQSRCGHGWHQCPWTVVWILVLQHSNTKSDWFSNAFVDLMIFFFLMQATNLPVTIIILPISHIDREWQNGGVMV